MNSLMGQKKYAAKADVQLGSQNTGNAQAKSRPVGVVNEISVLKERVGDISEALCKLMAAIQPVLDNSIKDTARSPYPTAGSVCPLHGDLSDITIQLSNLRDFIMDLTDDVRL